MCYVDQGCVLTCCYLEGAHSIVWPPLFLGRLSVRVLENANGETQFPGPPRTPWKLCNPCPAKAQWRGHRPTPWQQKDQVTPRLGSGHGHKWTI